MGKLQSISPFRLSALLGAQKDPKLALQLFENPTGNDPKNQTSKPFRYSLLCYDRIICKLGRAKMFKEMEKIVENLRNDTRVLPKEVIFCSIISFYGRARLHSKALQMFDQIPSFRCQRTIRSVNTLLNALLMCGEFDKMMEVTKGISKFASPDTCTYNILIKSCCALGNVDNAWNVFDEMQKREFQPNAVTFATLISGLCANSRLQEALKLKQKMESCFGIRPTVFVYSALIKSLSKANKLDSAIKLKNEMVKKKVELDSVVYATLISALFKAGRKEDGIRLLEEMRKKGCKFDTVTYNVLIYEFCSQNDFDSALKILKEMEDKKEKGCANCKPDVISYNIIIRGLCREGKLKKANDLFEDMPRKKCFPDVITYRILFDGFVDHGLLFKEAAFILDEMIFNNHLPRASSICKFVEGIVTQYGNSCQLWMALQILAKGNFSDATIWTLVISSVCKNDTKSIAFAFLDTLTVGNNQC